MWKYFCGFHYLKAPDIFFVGGHVFKNLYHIIDMALCIYAAWYCEAHKFHVCRQEFPFVIAFSEHKHSYLYGTYSAFQIQCAYK